MMSWLKIINDHLYLSVYAKPGASKNEITGLNADNSRICIKIKAPPVDGKANEELIKYLSKLFKVPKNSILINKGEASKQKTLIFRMSIEDIAEYFKRNFQK